MFEVVCLAAIDDKEPKDIVDGIVYGGDEEKWTACRFNKASIFKSLYPIVDCLLGIVLLFTGLIYLTYFI